MRFNKSVALKATQQHEGQSLSQEKKKKVKDDSSSGEEDSNAEVAFMIRNLRKFMKKKSNGKTYGDGKRRFKKRFCYGCDQTGHFIADCPNEKRSTSTIRMKTRRTKARREVKLILVKSGSQMIVTQAMMRRRRREPQTSPSTTPLHRP